MEIIDKLCELVHFRKYKKAEELLLRLLEENNTVIIKAVYHSFNNHYYKWAKKNHININSERDKLNHQDHSNFLISHTKNVAEMDDLLYGFVSDSKKEEIMYNLDCYKKQIN